MVRQLNEKFEKLPQQFVHDLIIVLNDPVLFKMHLTFTTQYLYTLNIMQTL